MKAQHPVSTPWLAAAASILVALASASMAAEPSSAPAEVIVLPAAVGFEAAGFYDYLSLTVGGPDGSVTRRYGEGASSLSFDLVEEEGTLRADGLYAYELRGLASGDDKEVLLASGYFSIRDGAFVSPELPERLEKDTVILDDLIVDTNVCIGFDCQDGESFGYFGLKLKENNTRILFDDTSSTGVFPARDWALIANESPNGGAEQFVIADCGTTGIGCEFQGTNSFTLMGGAPENALFVASDGDLGLGTNVPDAEIHTVDGDTPKLRLDQDGSSGFSPQIWDVAGNEHNFYIGDITAGNLVFRMRAGAPQDSLYVGPDGDVGLGTDSPGARLDVDGSIVLSGTVDGRDVAADGDTLDAHVADLANPHQVTADQVGAVSQAALDAHTGDLANPHQVTAAQTGADPAGSAATAVAAHEAAFDHGNLPSALPVPVAEGGTGATDAATARANLGITDDPTKAGLLLPGSFAGNPVTASVTFAASYPAGTSYVVMLTAFSNDDKKTLTANLIAKDETGFTVVLDGKSSDLVEVDWMARPVTE